jgi:serine/threonine protein kinase
MRIGPGLSTVGEVWLQDLTRAVLSRFTFRGGFVHHPIWSPDGTRIVFSDGDVGGYSYDIFQKLVTGSDKEESLLHTSSVFLSPLPRIESQCAVTEDLSRPPCCSALIISNLSLIPGTRLGVYEVIAPIGEGGMGQVFRATDTKLKRQVAIKILPPSLAADHHRLARFQREAEVLASLNHPNIAAIYGLEENGGITALVMELVDGDDLSQRIARGAIPIDEALPIAKQIADALEGAHEQGIIHRDLKPANIKVRADGTVKVLDFGLAKAMESAGTMASSVSMSPTITTPAMTQAGMILGTAAYMSPEQAKGRTVDKRCDVWAFGAVLYEMLAGRRAYAGEDITDTIVSVVGKEPDWAALPSSTPLPLRSLLRRCLDKDPRRRLRDIGEARLALETANDPQPAPVRQGRSPLLWALAVIAIVSLAFSAFALWQRPEAVQKISARLTIPLPPGAEITSYPAITRDGRTVAYVAQQGTEDSQLYLRDLNSFAARAVAGSNGAKQPFFSPDGKWVAFFAQGQLQKVEVAGGTPIRIVEATYAVGGTWNEDKTIIYTASLGSGLLRIPASGGTPETLTKPDGAAKGYAHVFPQALPGGRRVLFTVWGQTQGGAVLSLDSGRWEIVLPTTTSGACDVRRDRRFVRSPPGRRPDRRHQSRAVRSCAACAHERRYVGAVRRVLRHRNRDAGLAGRLERRYRSLRARQPRQDFAGLGRPGRKDRIVGQGAGCLSGSEHFAGRNEGGRPARSQPVDS